MRACGEDHSPQHDPRTEQGHVHRVFHRREAHRGGRGVQDTVQRSTEIRCVVHRHPDRGQFHELLDGSDQKETDERGSKNGLLHDRGAGYMFDQRRRDGQTRGQSEYGQYGTKTPPVVRFSSKVKEEEPEQAGNEPRCHIEELQISPRFDFGVSAPYNTEIAAVKAVTVEPTPSRRHGIHPGDRV